MTERRVATVAKRRGRGRPPVDSDGGVILSARVTGAHADLLDDLAQAHGLGGRAATVRAVLNALADGEVRAALARALGA